MLCWAHLCSQARDFIPTAPRSLRSRSRSPEKRLKFCQDSYPVCFSLTPRFATRLTSKLASILRLTGCSKLASTDGHPSIPSTRCLASIASKRLIPHAGALRVGLQGQSDVAQIAQQVASAAIQALPGVISGLLSSHLQMRMQTAQWGGIAPQGIGTSFVGLPAMHPLQQQLLQQAVAQQLSQQTSQFGGLFPQSYGGQIGINPMQQQDLPQLVQQAVAQQLRQQTSQFGGIAPQGFGIQGGGIGGWSFYPTRQDLPQLIQQAMSQQWRQQNAQFGAPAFQGNPISGFPGFPQPEIAQLVQQITGLIAVQIPNVVHGAISTIAGPRI